MKIDEMSFRDLNTDLDEGKMLLTSLSILTGHDFSGVNTYNNLTFEEMLDILYNLSIKVFKIDINKNIDYNLNESKLLLESVNIIRDSNRFTSFNYGDDKYIDDVFESLIKEYKNNKRNSIINSIINVG